MDNQNTNISQVPNLIQDEESIDQLFEQINKDISKALLEIKEENKEQVKSENNINENIFTSKEKQNRDYNENNIITPNIFNNFNGYKSNKNNCNDNIFPNNQFLRNSNYVYENINNIMTPNNINNNNDKNMITNNIPRNNLILDYPIFNINIINYNKNFKNKNKNKKSSKQNKIVSYRGVPGLYNSDFSKNIINIEKIIQYKDTRTTLIIRNIPNKYDISLLIKELNKTFENKFDVIYLPFDIQRNSNLGFGFINFVNPIHILLFCEEFIGKKWNFSNSLKRCYLAYANYQGKNELVEYVFNKLGIKDLTDCSNNETLKKSFFINIMKNLKVPIEIPLKYLALFVKYYPLCLCRKKDDKVFIFDI